MKIIYEKIIKGDSLTDSELLDGYAYFTKLANYLSPLGDRFAFAHSEAMYVKEKLYFFIIFRGIEEKLKYETFSV